jgi:hypothetical protein
MTGRHRKASPSASLQLSRVGALALLATAPLAAVGTASASPTTGTSHTPEKRSHDHGSDHSTSDSDGSGARHRGRNDSASRSRTRYLGLAHDDEASTPPRRSRSGSSSRLGSTQATDAQWDRLAACESSGNWDANTGNGYKGGLQFDDRTWRAHGGNSYAPSADRASREEQIVVGKQVQREQGWRAWPSCGGRLGGA